MSQIDSATFLCAKKLIKGEMKHQQKLAGLPLNEIFTVNTLWIKQDRHNQNLKKFNRLYRHLAVAQSATGLIHLVSL